MGSLFNNSSRRPYVIWNFKDATSITINRNLHGALLAPKADLTSGTQIDGSVFIGGNFTQRSEVHLPTYLGVVPPTVVPEPGTLLLVGGGLASALARARRSRRG